MWVIFILCAAGLLTVELAVLNRQRRLLFAHRGPAPVLVPQELKTPTGQLPGVAGAAEPTRPSDQAGRFDTPSVHHEPVEAPPRSTESPVERPHPPQPTPDAEGTPSSRSKPRRRLKSHAARDVLYWINVGEEVDASTSEAVAHSDLSRQTQSGEQVVITDRRATVSETLATPTQLGTPPLNPAEEPPATSEKSLPENPGAAEPPSPPELEVATASSPGSQPRPAEPVTVSPGPASRADGVGGNGSSTTSAPAPPALGEEGIVYVDGAGRLTFANQVARQLLHWSSGELMLSDVLAGGSEESIALLEAVARQEVIEQPVTLLAGAARARVDISALALRDRDGNLWGAALFIRRPAPS